MDDGSTDETSEVARRHGVTVIRHEVNRGLAAARNTGIRTASAPIVAFLDDARSTPGPGTTRSASVNGRIPGRCRMPGVVIMSLRSECETYAVARRSCGFSLRFTVR